MTQAVIVGAPFGYNAPPAPSIETDGEIKTQSVNANFYYRYPKWRVSPYAGFGLGAFFHDGTVTTTVTFERCCLTEFIPSDPFRLPPPPPPPPIKTVVTYDDSRFAYQVMGGLSARISTLLEFHAGYRFRSSRGAAFDADHIEAGIRFRF